MRVSQNDQTAAAEAGDLRYGLAAIYQSKCKMSHEILAK